MPDAWRASHARLYEVPFIKIADLKKEAKAMMRDLVAFRSYQAGETIISREHGGGECDVDVTLEALAVEPEHERGEVGRHLRGHPRRL